MIDFEKIGTRIAEERKFVKRVSQRKMAEDLNMYQADISNLEKAKNGSGITASIHTFSFLQRWLVCHSFNVFQHVRPCDFYMYSMKVHNQL